MEKGENILEEGCFFDMSEIGPKSIRKESGKLVFRGQGDEAMFIVRKKGDVEEIMANSLKRQKRIVKNLQKKFEAESKILEEMENFIRLSEEFLVATDDGFDWGWHKTHVPQIFHGC